MHEIIRQAEALAAAIDALPLEQKIEVLNDVRALLHEISPFRDEPVDLVTWVPALVVRANEYNPNRVASPEMKLLELSIDADGFTQPIVTMPDEEGREVVDGFHRHRVGKEIARIRKRIHGHLPVVSIRGDRRDKSSRVAATIRHNRARGKHQVQSMADIVGMLRASNMSDAEIARALGMEPEELLRLGQVGGIAAAYADRDFSRAWE